MRRALLAFGITLAAAAPASATPTWLEPVALSPSVTARPATAIAPSGDAVAVWELGGRIEARTRAPGGAFDAVQVMGAAGSSEPIVRMAEDGTAIAAWMQPGGVAWALRAPGGSFGAAQDLDAGGAVSDLRLDVNGAGGAVIAFVRGTRAHASLRPAGGSFGAPVAVSAGQPCDLDAAIGEGDHAAVAWRDCGAGTGSMRVARRQPGAGFGAPDVLSAAMSVATAVAPNGDTAAVWQDAAGAIRGAVASPASAFGTSQRLSPEGELADGPLAVAAGTELWAGFRSGERAAARRVNGVGSVLFASAGGAITVTLAGARDGTMLAAWSRSVDGDVLIEAARRPAGIDSFEAAKPVSAAGTDSGVPWPAVDATGNGAVVFSRGGPPVLRVLDGAGPRFGAIDIRQGGFALEPYEFGLDATDAWSAVASSAIDFGDGTSAAGPRATHAYGSAGARTVTFRATDAVGNVGLAPRPFTVLPALDRTAPVITNAKLDAKRFRVSRKETAVTAAVRRGTRLRYTLSEPAQANIFFERVRGMGRLKGGECQRGVRRGRRCRIYAPAGYITRRHPVAGPVSVGFSGRITARNGALRVVDVVFKPGRYRVTITAADATRNVSAPVELGFTIRR